MPTTTSTPHKAQSSVPKPKELAQERRRLLDMIKRSEAARNASAADAKRP